MLSVDGTPEGLDLLVMMRINSFSVQHISQAETRYNFSNVKRKLPTSPQIGFDDVSETLAISRGSPNLSYYNESVRKFDVLVNRNSSVRLLCFAFLHNLFAWLATQLAIYYRLHEKTINLNGVLILTNTYITQYVLSIC